MVELHIKEQCVGCNIAKMMLQSRNIQFTVIKDEQFRDISYPYIKISDVCIEAPFTFAKIRAVAKLKNVQL